MCGVAGIHSWPQSNENDNKIVAQALVKEAFRGPDHSEVYQNSNAILGHCRLSIIDSSARSNQPFTDETKRYTLIFNGEIFNYLELKKRPELSQIEWKTNSDTEVLLHLLIKNGKSTLELLNGFFAFAFYDAAKDEMLIARDRFGEKPLWFAHQNDRLYFASGLRPLFEMGVSRQVDFESVHLFLQLTYIPAPHSIIKGVKKLLPGHFITFQSGQIHIEKWYKPSSSNYSLDNNSSANSTFKSLLNDAVKIRLIGDAPLGAFLSGGVDSAIIASLALEHKTDLKTFSIGFPDTPFLDESTSAQETANYIGSKHTTIHVTSLDLENEFGSVVNALEEPFSDSSSIAVHLLSRMVKQEVTVTLSGDGADELLAGYRKHMALFRSIHRPFEKNWSTLAMPFLQMSIGNRTSAWSNQLRQFKRYAEGLALTPVERYLFWASFSKSTVVSRLLKKGDPRKAHVRLLNVCSLSSDPTMNDYLIADQDLVLANDMLVKVDSMSMHVALEVRPPFLDHRVVEFTRSLPDHWKTDGKNRKIILRKCYEKDLPPGLFDRPKKGFEIPLEHWLRSTLKNECQGIASESGHLSDLIDLKELQNILYEFYQKQKSDHASLLFSLIVLSRWCEANKINLREPIQAR